MHVCAIAASIRGSTEPATRPSSPDQAHQSPFPFPVALHGTHRVQTKAHLLLPLHYPSPSRRPDPGHYGGCAAAGPDDHSPAPHHLSPHGAVPRGRGAIGEAQPLGGARCRTAEGRTVSAPSGQVVRALVGSIVWPSSADPASRGAILATAAVGIPIRQQWRLSPTGGARPSLPRAVTASPIGGATSSMVDLPAATLPRPAAAATTPSRDRHPPCQARGCDALPRPRQRWRRPSPSSSTSSPTDGGAGGHHALVDCGPGTGSNGSESPAPEDGDTAATRRRHLGAGPVAAPHPHLRHPNQALPPSVVGGRGARLPRDLPRHRLPLDEGLVQYVLDHPIMLWFVGPMFAALTGLVFKEGLCYGKREAGISTFVIPGLLLGHLVVMFTNKRLRYLVTWATSGRGWMPSPVT